MVESVVQSRAEIVVGSAEKKLIRVLHVDDELGLLKVAKQCLELQGPFQVDTACSVEEALNKLKEKEYDAIVSDYQMPGKDGLEFLETLRKNRNTIPFVMFTGKGREEVAVKAWSLGADHYVNKTGDPETVYCELAHCLRSSVEKHVAKARAEETIERLQAIYQNAVEGISYVDVEENIVYANKAFADIVGYEQDQLLGMNLHKIVDDENWAKIKGETERRRHGEPSRYEVEFHRSDGTVRNVLVSGAPLLGHNGRFAGTVGIVLDNTDRKKAEDALRTSEERYRVISSITADLVFSCARKGEGQFTIDWIAGAVKNVFGYSAEEVRETGCWKFVVQEQDLPIFEEKVTGLKPGQSSVCELRINHKDGSTRWIKTSSQVAKDSINPTYHRLFGACEDITERKKTEELLGESEERFRGLFESIQDPVGIFVGREGRLIDYNAAFKKSSGYTNEELKGKAFLDFVHPGDHALVLEKYQTEYSEDEYPLIYEIRGMNKKGECIPLELSVSTYRKKGKVIGIEVIHRDLTERKKVEMSLKESQERFEGLFQGNPEAAAYLDPDYRIQDVNPRFEELFEYSLEQIRGKHINDVVVPDCRRGEGEALDRDARKGYVYRNTVRRKKDGSLVPVSVSAAPITNESGVTGIVAMYKDISDLKNAEKKLEAMNEKLRVVGGLTRHDVRNKLSAITGNAYLLKKQLADNKEGLGKVRDMETAVSQVTRIFDFAKDYEMLGVEELAYIDVQKSVNEAFQLFQDLKGVRVLNECHGLTVLSDSLLRQLFYNLIDNSLKYGEKLSQIRIHCEKAEGNQLRLVYEDDGVGIPHASKPKLFDEGYTTGKGSGYGLYLVKKMMDVYGWAISETGMPGKGARFTMDMPERNQNGKENYQLH